MAAKKMPAKKAVATRRSADATAGAKAAGLKRLEKGLSGQGMGSADRSTSAGNQRRAALMKRAASEGPKKSGSAIAAKNIRGGQIGASMGGTAKGRLSQVLDFGSGFGYGARMSPAQRAKSFRKNTPPGRRPGK